MDEGRPGSPKTPQEIAHTAEDGSKGGWIRAYRRIQEHPYWAEPEKLWAFLSMLFKARWRPGWNLWKPGPQRAQRIWVPRGSFCTSSHLLAEEWRPVLNWPERRVRRFLEDAEEEGEIYRPGHLNMRLSACVRRDPKSVNIGGNRRESEGIGVNGRLAVTEMLTDMSPLLTIVNYDRYNPPSDAPRPTCRPGRVRDVSEMSVEVPHSTSTYERVEEGEEEIDGGAVAPPVDKSVHNPLHGLREVADAFRFGSGKLTWSPSARDRMKILEAIQANGGQWEEIADTVRRVTAEYTRETGEPPRSVCYGLAAFENQKRERASEARDPKRREPVAKPEARSYHSDFKPRPDDGPVTEEGARVGLEDIGSVLKRLKTKEE